jgi:hypothetical protein
MDLPAEISHECWIAQLFGAKAVGRGGVIRRKATDVDRLIGRERFLFEVERRGFSAVENNGQLIVFCNRAPSRVLV